jgi:hypothetical protein
VDDFLSPTEVKEALASARYIEAQSSNESSNRQQVDENQQQQKLIFAPSQNQRDEVTRGQKRVRSDRVCFLGGSNVNSNNSSSSSDDEGVSARKETQQLAGLKHVHALLRGVSCTVDESDVFTGFSSSSTTTTTKQAAADSWMGVDHAMQVSLYDKEEDGTDNSTRGAYYRPHQDGCSDAWTDLGLLGYLRSTYLRKRYLTAVLYINDTNTTNGDDSSSWSKERDGGCLRLFVPTTTDLNHDDKTKSTEDDTVPFLLHSFVDVEPIGGRLVLFSSQHLWHAVRPTLRQRFACTLWTYLNE